VADPGGAGSKRDRSFLSKVGPMLQSGAKDRHGRRHAQPPAVGQAPRGSASHLQVALGLAISGVEHTRAIMSAGHKANRKDAGSELRLADTYAASSTTYMWLVQHELNMQYRGVGATRWVSPCSLPRSFDAILPPIVLNGSDSTSSR
jgi:hypothetical protein